MWPIAFALLFVGGLVLGSQLIQRLGPRAKPTPDPAGLRTVARFSHRGADLADLMDTLSSRIANDAHTPAFEVSPWVWTREGCDVQIRAGATHFRVELRLYTDCTLFLTAFDQDGTPMGPPPDGSSTRALLATLDAALRAHPKVSDVGWQKREHYFTRRDERSEAPFGN